MAFFSSQTLEHRVARRLLPTTRELPHSQSSASASFFLLSVTAIPRCPYDVFRSGKHGDRTGTSRDGSAMVGTPAEST